MNVRFIEMVCTGNQGRSPVAELIAQNYLRRLGTVDYASRSSGTLVDTIEKGELPKSFKLQTIELAKRRGVYSPSDEASIQDALKQGNDTMIDNYFNQAVARFSEEEKTHRIIALKRFGIEGRVKEGRDQTIVRSESIVVLSMAQSNNSQVQSIYAHVANKPIMMTIGEYATNNPKSDVPNAFGLGQKEYESAIEVLMDYVPKSLDKLFEKPV